MSENNEEESEQLEVLESETDIEETTSEFINTSDDDDEDYEDECTEEALLARRTSSFRCLHQLVLSDSSLLRHPLYHFPPLTDPGIEETFCYVEPEKVYPSDGVLKYIDMCQELNIVPLKRIINLLTSEEMDLKYYGLREEQIFALTEALKINTIVKSLILEDNFLTPKSVEWLSNMIENNSVVTSINLRQCRVGREGAVMLNNILLTTITLTELDLSFNNLGDEGFSMLEKGLCSNSTLKKLDVSHNHLTELSAKSLEAIFTENGSIEDLNLSWSKFNTTDNKKLFLSLTKKQLLKRLNLAWNYIGKIVAVKPIMIYLIKTKVLEFLDLSNNQLEGRAVVLIKRGMVKNTSLEEIKLGNNPYSPEEAFSLLTAFSAKSTNDPLKILDMENMLLKKISLPTIERIKQLGKTIKFGGILSNYKIIGPDTTKLLFERIHFILLKPKKLKKKIDFGGQFVLQLPDNPLSPDEFKALMKKKKVKKLDQDLLNELFKKFTIKNKKIDCVEMKRVYMGYYPDTVLPPPPPPKKKKGKKGGRKRKGKKTIGDEQLPPKEEQEVVQPIFDTGEPQSIPEGGETKPVEEDSVPQTVEEKLIQEDKEVLENAEEQSQAPEDGGEIIESNEPLPGEIEDKSSISKRSAEEENPSVVEQQSVATEKASNEKNENVSADGETVKEQQSVATEKSSKEKNENVSADGETVKEQQTVITEEASKEDLSVDVETAIENQLVASEKGSKKDEHSLEGVPQ